MQGLNKALMLCASVFLLSGCAVVRTPMTGIMGGAALEFSESPLAVTSQEKTDKTGQACASNYLGLFATGDASIETAKANGGITVVTSVDYKSTRALGYMGTFCTVVQGY